MVVANPDLDPRQARNQPLCSINDVDNPAAEGINVFIHSLVLHIDLFHFSPLITYHTKGFRDINFPDSPGLKKEAGRE
jgi:hypothetical protein